MRVFYDPSIKKGDQNFVLSEEESKHIVKVLRLKEDDSLILLNGVGGEFECKIIEAHAKKCKVEITASKFHEKSSNEVHIAIAPTKQMDRLEWFVEKATEVGVTKISLIDSKNAERSTVKMERFYKKAISAMKQSQRTFLPVLDDVISLKEFISQYPKGLIAHCEEEDKFTISDKIQPSNCPILIGPEGDFTTDEIKLVKDSGYVSVTLGDNRLRTETAGMYAVVEAKLAMK